MQGIWYSKGIKDQYLDLVGDPDWPQDELTGKMRAVRDQMAAVDTQLAETNMTALVNAEAGIIPMLRLLADPQTPRKTAPPHKGTPS